MNENIMYNKLTFWEKTFCFSRQYEKWRNEK